MRPNYIDFSSKTKPISFSLFLCHAIHFRDMKYFYGTDEYKGAAAIEQIKKEPVNHNRRGFTSRIGEALNIDLIKKDFPPIPLVKTLIYEMPQGPLILNSLNYYEKAWCYDIHSAYPAILLENKFPKRLKKVSKIGKGEHLCKIKLTNFKAKFFNNYPLYLNKTCQLKNNPNLKIIGKRIIEGSSYIFYCFYEREIELLKFFYEIEKIELLEIYKIEFGKLPQPTIEAIKALYFDKSNKKDTPEYNAAKQKLNRMYGFFATLIKENGIYTLRNKNVPWLVAAFIVSRERELMFKAIKACGIEHLISGHTDGLKFDYDCGEIFNRLNKERGELYLDCGQWDFEGTLDCVQYLSNTRAKYYENGVLKMKHGGISDEDINKFLENKEWKDIKYNSIINFTYREELKFDKEIIRLIKIQTPVELSKAGLGGDFK